MPNPSHIPPLSLIFSSKTSCIHSASIESFLFGQQMVSSHSTGSASVQLSTDAVQTMIYPKVSSPTADCTNLNRTSAIAQNNDPESVVHYNVMIRNIRQVHSNSISRNFLPCQVSDQEFTVDGILYCTAMTDVDKLMQCKSCLIRVNGYITSEANLVRKTNVDISKNHGFGSSNSNIFLCITDFQILHLGQHCLMTGHLPLNSEPNGIKVPARAGKISGGLAATSLQQTLACFTDEELAGIPTQLQFLTEGTCNQASDRERIQKIQSFLTNHQAMEILSRNGNEYDHSNVATAPSTSAKGINMTGNYSKAIGEFSEAQMKRQIVSLTDNISGECSENATKMVSQYSSAVLSAISHAKSSQCLAVEDICRWHEILGEGIIANAGQLRKKTVRAGSTVFTDKNEVRSELEKYVSLIRGLEVRLLHNQSSSPWSNDDANLKRGYGPLLFAAVAFFVLCDIHPFHDGNGRLSRILSNWALRRAGFPFVINLFATPQQRAEYINGIEITRRNIMMTSIGSVSPDVYSTTRRMVGILKPLVGIFIERVQKATIECQNVVSEKSRIDSDEMEAKAAKRFRETAAAGSCLICMDDNPNIATLCCGKAVHINCMATWLSNRLECPHCRNTLPSLPQREPASPSEDSATVFNDSSFDDDNESMTAGDSTTIVPENEAMDADTTFWDTTDETNGTDDVFTEDATTNESLESEMEQETITTSQPRTLPLVCSFQACRNRAAVGCSTSGCGRCCQLYGQYNCERHNM